MDLALRHFAEEMGLLMSEVGGQRMLGRVLGWLMVCDPPEQTAAQIAEGIEISAGAVSGTMRQLTQTRMVEKLARPGDRATYYRIRDGMWVDTMRARLGMNTLMLGIADRGLDALSDESDARRRRLLEMRDFYAYLEEEMPRLLDGWQSRHSGRKERR